MDWIFDMFKNKSQEKKAELLTDNKKEFERKVEKNDWILDAMKTDEGKVATEEEQKFEAEEIVRGLRQEAGNMETVVSSIIENIDG